MRPSFCAPLASANNLLLKELVSNMSEAGFSLKTMHNCLRVIKMVVASAVNDQRTPTFRAEEAAKIVSTAQVQLRVLFSLLSGTGLRIGEVLALEVKDICATKITARQWVWNSIVQSPKTRNDLREVDVHSSLAALLREHIADRESGFLFQNTGGKPISPTNVRKSGVHRCGWATQSKP